MLLFIAAQGSKPRPGLPCCTIKKPCQPELARDAAREHDGLKGLPEDREDKHHAKNDRKNFHRQESPQALEYLKCRKNWNFL
jgi:hypothetical protein